MDPITLMMMGLGLGQSAYGFFQNMHGKDRAARNIRDPYSIPEEAYQNLGQAEQMAQTGMPQNELDFIHQNALRGLSSSLSAGLQVGADANQVGDYYQNYLNELGDIGLKNATMRFSNLNALVDARQELENQRQIQFGYNDAAKRDEAQLASLEQQQGMQNIFSGLNTGATSLVQQKNRQLYDDQLELQREALGLGRNKGVETETAPRMPVMTVENPNSVLKMSAPDTSAALNYLNYINPNNPSNPNSSLKLGPVDTSAVLRYLNKNNLASPATDNSSFFWKKYAAPGDSPLWQDQPLKQYYGSKQYSAPIDTSWQDQPFKKYYGSNP